MAFLSKIFNRDKPSAEDFTHAQLLITLFEESEIFEEDIEEFRKVCQLESWDYDSKVVEHLDGSLKRSLRDLKDDQSLDTYKNLIGIFQTKIDQFRLPEGAISKIHKQMVFDIYNHFLNRLKKVSREHFLGIECETLLHMVEIFAFDEEDKKFSEVDEKLNIITLNSIKTNIKYIQILLTGENPRYDIIFKHHGDLMRLARKYKFADIEAIKNLIYELTENIYEKVQVYLLIADSTTNSIYQSREKVFEITLKNMDAIQYRGRWEQKIRDMDLLG